jgi:CheY-like chemotaxis protein
MEGEGGEEMVRPKNVKGGSETILIAEDKPGVRGELASEILRCYGYTTVEATDGNEVVRVFTANQSRTDLVSVDVVMPGKNGREVCKEIWKILPKTRFLYTSGYSGDIVIDKGVEETPWSASSGSPSY